MAQRYMTPQELEMMRMRARDGGYEPIPDDYPELQNQSVMPDADSMYPPEPEPEPQIQSPARSFMSPSVPPPKSNADRLMDEQRALMEEYNNPSTVQMKKLQDLLDSYPEHEKPSFVRALIASGLAIGKQGSLKESQEFLNRPFDEKLADWKAKANPAYQAAQLENNQNVNSRLAATSMMNARTAAARLEESERTNQANIASREKLAAAKNALEQERLEGTSFFVAGEKIWGKKNDGTIYDTGEDAKNYSTIELKRLEIAGAQRRVETQGQNQRDIAGANITSREKIADEKSWGPPVMIKDEQGRDIAVQTHTGTGEVREVKIAGRNVGTITKPGTPGQASGITNSTKTMMEGAQMLLPHIPDLRKQATELDKRGLFGPIMSRVREYAAKIGTTGSPEEVEKSFNDFAVNIMNDPLLTQSNDAAVGQFAMGLGLAASGAGRVHGGARGGGSIQMVNYMKALLSADSSLSMFNGRMNELEKWMKGYAIGPGGSVVTEEKKVPDAIDIAIEKALKGGK